MKIAALLTGKGSSTLKNKNILKIFGKPVLWYPATEALKVKKIKGYFVSSEDKKILNISEKLGYKKILRPKKYAKANSKHLDVLLHAIKEIKKQNFSPEIIVILLANAPIIKKKWIEDCIEILIKNKSLTGVVPVILDNDKNPFRAKKIKNGIIQNFTKQKNKISSNRQELPNSYFLCHNFWVLKKKAILENNGPSPWNFMGKKVFPYVIKRSIDIHTEADLNLAKFLLKKI